MFAGTHLAAFAPKATLPVGLWRDDGMMCSERGGPDLGFLEDFGSKVGS